jgi:hypothetical protein
MNLCAAPSPSPSSSASSVSEPERQRGEARECGDAAACEAFALALQSRQQRHQQPGSDEAEAPPEPTLAGPAPTPLLALMHAPSFVPTNAVGAIDPASRTQAAIEASLRDLPIAPVHPLAAAEPAMTWEATLSGPNAVPVELRATRTDPTTPNSPQALWGLTVSSSALGADVLARHAPRLTERLRKQAIDVDHVRIERRDTDANPH